MANNHKYRRKNSAHLVWDSKPRRAANPKDIEFQTAEVVIPNPQTAGELPLSFRDGLFGETDIDKQKMNRLIWGDNLLAMQALLAQGYEGKINLIYIDPPFDSKADYSHRMTIEGNEVTKEPSVIERLAYKDTWVGGTDSYLDMFYPRLQLMKRLLADDGTIWVHLDWHIGHYVKVILDEVFGKGNFLNEICWKSATSGSSKAVAKRFGLDHENLLVYVKDNQNYIFNKQYTEYSEEYVKQEFRYKDDNGFYKSAELATYSQDKLEQLKKENKLIITGGRKYRYKIYLHESPGVLVDSVWKDITFVTATAKERVGFDTQKPVALLERIIKASSDEGDLIADFFMGSGTTTVTAEKLTRRWIGCELGKIGVQVTRSRLVEIGAQPFLIENIGNYQREMIYLTGGRIWEMQHLILKLYGATPRDKMSGLGVRKTEDGVEELVYVGYPDRPITAKKAEELATQAQKLDGRGYKRLIILGWDYEYNYHQALEARKKALKDKLKVQIESRDIPPDIYDYLKKAKSEEDIEALADKVHFYERPYLRLEKPIVKDIGDGKVQIGLGIKRYVLMDVPLARSTKKEQETYQELLKIAKDNFAVLIDYWAIDWDYDGYTFKSQWQAFRGNGKRAKTVIIEATDTLPKKKRTIAVRVVDIFGNDAGATIDL